MGRGLTWVIEREAFSHGDAALLRAATAAGHDVKLYDELRGVPSFDEPLRGPALFHGSLALAVRAARSAWSPGAWCNAPQYAHSRIVPALSKWALNAEWETTTVAELLAQGDRGARFVRPDSALKPFAGHVVRGAPTPAELGLGYYHCDIGLPVVVCPAKPVGDEWRFAVVGKSVVAGCQYDAATRSGLPDRAVPSGIRSLADWVAAEFNAPDPGYVLDVCSTPAGPRVVEVNPFSGADLYGCDCEALVAAAGEWFDR